MVGMHDSLLIVVRSSNIMLGYWLVHNISLFLLNRKDEAVKRVAAKMHEVGDPELNTLADALENDDYTSLSV